MSAAAEAATAPGSPRLLAVTVLTSMDASELAGSRHHRLPRRPGPPPRQARRRTPASTAWSAPPKRSPSSAKKPAPDTLLVIPGIRPAGSAVGDQKRIATPAQAIADGASLLVVGRPITRAADPAAAARAILHEIEQAHVSVARQKSKNRK